MTLRRTISVVTITLAILAAGCAREGDETDQTDAAVRGATQAIETPSVSSVESATSVAPTKEEIAQMSDEEILTLAISHSQAILANLQQLDTSTLDGKMAERLPNIIQRLTDRITKLQSDTAFRAQVVQRIRSGGFRPFRGGYEGNRPPWHGKKGMRNKPTVEELCSFLKEKIEGNQFRNEEMRTRILSKYESMCSSS